MKYRIIATAFVIIILFGVYCIFSHTASDTGIETETDITQ